MYAKIYFLLGLFASTAYAAIGDACSTSSGSGTCQKTSVCTGFNIAGACPNDPTDVKCCIKKSCSTPSGAGTCRNTSYACAGSLVSGYCPGDSTIRCCVPSSGGGGGAGVGAKVLAAARTQGGVPYSWGGGGCNGKARGIDSGANTIGFDCSGLTQYAICQATGKATVIPRTTKTQYAGGTKIPRAQAQPGDLIFWANGGDCSCSNGYCAQMYHVAIWIGNGRIYEAQKTGTNVGEFAMRTTNVCPYAVRYW